MGSGGRFSAPERTSPPHQLTLPLLRLPPPLPSIPPFHTTQSGARELDSERQLKEQAVEAILVRWQYSGMPWDPLANAAAEYQALAGTTHDGGAGAGAGASSSSSSSSSSSGSARPPAPPGYLEMPGFAGVYVGWRDDVEGDVRDTRPVSPRPSHSYLITLPSKTLKDMWRAALVNQREVLVKNEVRMLWGWRG